ncbi:hypothetical protein J2Y86_003819 [Pseudomonas migulae]|uniref:hypothetical protein n=1 Tax=Pseudomonas migulae TaxID=78543 RepID=UPI00209E0615|nr:hypothetical protein [Pseudomonas migulae]MCP1499112.1 hypothetical protein [Pseudomonas migulae]
MSRGDGYDQIFSLWGIQESLLQAYRSIFITAESIIISVAATIATSSPVSALMLTFLGCFQLWMWHRVCANRAKDVSFTQWLLARAEEGADVSAPLACFKRFQAGNVITINDRSVWRDIEKAMVSHVHDEQFIAMTNSPTRRWMEIYLPLLFLLLWLYFACVALNNLMPSILGFLGRLGLG